MIEVGEKEKTACALIISLERKFLHDSKEKKVYTAKELHGLVKELREKINKNELRFIDAIITPEQIKKSESWDYIERRIEKSTIKRYDWTSVFGRSLTKEILSLKLKGYGAKGVYERLREDSRVKEFLEKYQNERKNILKNLKTSVNARFVENNTAKKMEDEYEE